MATVLLCRMRKSPGLAQEAVKYITKQFGDGWDLGGEKPSPLPGFECPRKIRRKGIRDLVNIATITTGLSMLVVLGRWRKTSLVSSALGMMAWPFTRLVVRPVYVGVKG